nr:hypothetical protein [Paenibacillus cellulosilyticus]
MKQKAKLQEKVQTLFAAIEAAEIAEEQEYQGKALPELGGDASSVTSEKLDEAIERLEAKLQERPKDKALKATHYQ